MTQVSIDDLLNEVKSSPKQTEKETPPPPPSKRRFKIPKMTRPKLPQNFNPGPLPQPGLIHLENVMSREEDREFSRSLKDSALYGSSYVIRNNEKKREKFYNRLKDSRFLNKYLDKKGMGFISDYLNEDGKALCIYSMAYTQTILEKDE
jgi:hypothetical protein